MGTQGRAPLSGLPKGPACPTRKGSYVVISTCRRRGSRRTGGHLTDAAGEVTAQPDERRRGHRAPSCPVPPGRGVKHWVRFRKRRIHFTQQRFPVLLKSLCLRFRSIQKLAAF